MLTPRAHGASAAHHNKKDRGLGLQKALLEAINFGKYRAEQDLGIFLQFPEIEQMSRDNLDENGGGNQSLKGRPVASL